MKIRRPFPFQHAPIQRRLSPLIIHTDVNGVSFTQAKRVGNPSSGERFSPRRVAKDDRTSRNDELCWAGTVVNMFILLVAVVFFTGCATPSQTTKQQEAPAHAAEAIEAKWGIKMLPAHLTAGGSMIDVRFRIIDPEKALPLTELGAKPYLIDEATGEKSEVPTYEKMGALRAKGNPKAGKNYFILFNNSKGIMTRGSKVTVVIGDFKMEHLVVE